MTSNLLKNMPAPLIVLSIWLSFAIVADVAYLFTSYGDILKIKGTFLGVYAQGFYVLIIKLAIMLLNVMVLLSNFLKSRRLYIIAIIGMSLLIIDSILQQFKPAWPLSIPDGVDPKAAYLQAT